MPYGPYAGGANPYAPYGYWLPGTEKPKATIPLGSTVTIVDFPIREINGKTGTVKEFDELSMRYKVEVRFDDEKKKKEPQEFLLAREKLQISKIELKRKEDGAIDEAAMDDKIKSLLAGKSAWNDITATTAAMLAKHAGPSGQTNS